MGYHASANGYVVVKEDTDYVAQRLSELFEIYRVTNNTIDFGITDDTYHRDEVTALLTEIADDCEEGVITYHGDDDHSSWRFVLKKQHYDENVWTEQSGRIVYDDPDAPEVRVETPQGILEVYVDRSLENPQVATLLRKHDGEHIDLCYVSVPLGGDTLQIAVFPDPKNEDAMTFSIHKEETL